MVQQKPGAKASPTLPVPVDSQTGPKGLGFGLPPSETHAALQTDVFKELINKIAWAIGSTYRLQYRNTRSPGRQCAIAMAQAVVRLNGYPRHIGKD